MNVAFDGTASLDATRTTRGVFRDQAGEATLFAAGARSHFHTYGFDTGVEVYAVLSFLRFGGRWHGGKKGWPSTVVDVSFGILKCGDHTRLEGG